MYILTLLTVIDAFTQQLNRQRQWRRRYDNFHEIRYPIYRQCQASDNLPPRPSAVGAANEREGSERQVAERRLLEEKQPSGVFSRSSDIGALAVFLCSESAANITGASLPVDGAWTAQ